MPMTKSTSTTILVSNTSLDKQYDDNLEIFRKLKIGDLEKVDNTSNQLQVSKNNNKIIHNTELKIKEIKNTKEINANNYVYLGSTNMSLLNTMGLTLEDDGSLLLIKGKTHDLFSGLYQKHFKGGFKYEGFNIVNNNEENFKFKELYIDSDGFLIGNKRDENSSNISENKQDLYKIKFSRIEEKIDLTNDIKSSENVIVEYEKYTPKANEVQELSSINNIIEQIEINEIKINRDGMNITIKLKDNQLIASGLPSIIESEQLDQLDSKIKEKECKINLPLKKNDKILAIKPVFNRVQLIIDREGEKKIYYLNPFHIFSIKEYTYNVTRLTKAPPLSFYSMVGQNNYNNYHSGQPFSSQTIGNFSSHHIPFFSSIIDNARIYFDKARESRALKKYTKLVKNVAKGIDPGFRGIFSVIRELTNSTISPADNKNMALYNIKKNIDKSYNVLNKAVKNIRNGKTQGEIIHTLTQEMKNKESIIISNYNDIRAFFGVNVFPLTPAIGVNAFILASYAKTHSMILTKNENDKIAFSFINNKDIDATIGLSAGLGSIEKRGMHNNISYGVVTPAIASILLDVNYYKSSNFSFELQLDEVKDFINNKVDFNEDELTYKSKFEKIENIGISAGAEFRSELSGDVDVEINNSTGMTIPRNAIGLNTIFKFFKLSFNINKIIDYGNDTLSHEKNEINLGLFEFAFDIYRDLKFTPSSTTADSKIQWYPLTAVKDFELIFQRKINSLFNYNIYSNEKVKGEEKKDVYKKDMKGIYKRILKINKLIDNILLRKLYLKK